MPFTISHTAAVLPFARHLNRWRALSAVVIGSMVPDFTLLVPWSSQRVDSHSIVGLFTFCLPIGLACYWLFEYVVKPATWEVLPDAAHERSRELATPDPIKHARQWLIASLGLIGGAITHLVWDAFTHEGARGVRMFPMLDDAVDIAGSSLQAYRIAQHLSSVLGLAVVLYVIAAAMRASPAVPPPLRKLNRPARRRWMACYVLAAMVFGAMSLGLTWVNSQNEKSLPFIIDAIAIAGLRGLLFSSLLVSALLLVSLRAQRPTED